jgi:hypothetical protein
MLTTQKKRRKKEVKMSKRFYFADMTRAFVKEIE